MRGSWQHFLKKMNYSSTAESHSKHPVSPLYFTGRPVMYETIVKIELLLGEIKKHSPKLYKTILNAEQPKNFPWKKIEDCNKVMKMVQTEKDYNKLTNILLKLYPILRPIEALLSENSEKERLANGDVSLWKEKAFEICSPFLSAASQIELKDSSSEENTTTILKDESNAENYRRSISVTPGETFSYVGRDNLGRGVGEGTRKTASSKAYAISGEGIVLINNKHFSQFFSSVRDAYEFIRPLAIVEKYELVKKELRGDLKPAHHTSVFDSLNIWIKTSSGGISGQLGASKLALAKALANYNEEWIEPLKIGKWFP